MISRSLTISIHASNESLVFTDPGTVMIDQARNAANQESDGLERHGRSCNKVPISPIPIATEAKLILELCTTNRYTMIDAVLMVQAPLATIVCGRICRMPARAGPVGTTRVSPTAVGICYWFGNGD